jgi:hypothetical protein
MASGLLPQRLTPAPLLIPLCPVCPPFTSLLPLLYLCLPRFPHLSFIPDPSSPDLPSPILPLQAHRAPSPTSPSIPPIRRSTPSTYVPGICQLQNTPSGAETIPHLRHSTYTWPRRGRWMPSRPWKCSVCRRLGTTTVRKLGAGVYAERGPLDDAMMYGTRTRICSFGRPGFDHDFPQRLHVVPHGVKPGQWALPCVLFYPAAYGQGRHELLRVEPSRRE